jgi:acyl-homoserine lactone acylase PvdQ
MPALVMWFAWAIFPVIYSKDILGSVKDFPDCSVVKFDIAIGKMIATNETIEVAQVDHEIKLVQAKTYEGAMFGLGFVHAKDRLF